MPEKILIIEDDPRMRRVLQLVLETRGYLVETAADGEDGILKWKLFQPDLVFTDLKMPRADGMGVMRHRNLHYPQTPVIMLTAFGTVPTAVEAMKQGACDYITKPIDNDIIIEKAATALAKKVSAPTRRRPDQPLLIGSSPGMATLKKELELVAATNTSVLITGESGTGKELAALTIQSLSHRKSNPFIRLNCAAIPRELMESELFGHVKGAFTNAVQDRKGAFLQANFGTLFLDEIGDLPYGLQAKLLHAVENKVITPVGSATPVKIDIKIISATNQDIREMICRQTFRSDLYFRLNTYEIHIPPLRERVEDIPELTDHFLDLFSKTFNQDKPRMHPEAMAALPGHAWPGNVRELKNMLERLTLVSKGNDITRAMVAQIIGKSGRLDAGSDIVPDKPLFVREKELIEEALTACGWNISRAARHLGITRNTLRYRIKKFNIRLS